MITEKVLGNLNAIEAGSRRIDRIRLTHDEIMKPHQKVTSEEGKSIGISLPEGEHLHNGDILYMDDAEIVVIDLKEEEVFEIRPKSNIEWARASFNIGNMHQKAYLYSDCIRVPYDYVLERMIESLGVEYSKEIRKLDGMPANISAAGHHHHGLDEHHHGHGRHCRSHGEQGDPDE